MEKDLISRPSNWALINLKARMNQTPEHYISFLEKTFRNDPMVDIGRKHVISLKTFTKGPVVAGSAIPQWIELIFTTYVIVDPDAFYDRKQKQDVSIEEWNSDIVVNKRELQTIFIPEVHTLAVRMNAKSTVNHIEKYLSKAVENVEPEMFDITIAKSHNTIQRILASPCIMDIQANLSFSNPGHTDGFIGAFDSKMKEVNPAKCTINMKGTKEHPLNNTDDGLVEAVVKLSELNGDVKATIREGNKNVIINTKEHPEHIRIISNIRNLFSSIRAELIGRYGSK